MSMTIQSRVKDKILTTPIDTSKVENAPAEMLRDLDNKWKRGQMMVSILWTKLYSEYEYEICYHPGKANVVTDALSRKERVKPRCVRAMAMTIQYGSEMDHIPRGLADAAKSVKDAIGFDGGYHSSIWCPPFEALYGRKCMSHVLWAEIRESTLTGLELVQETTDKVVFVKEKPKAARDRQKSYVDYRCKPLEFEVGDHVLLKVTPFCVDIDWKLLVHQIHAYKRSSRVYNYTLDPCGLVHITTCDGGNQENMMAEYADEPSNLQSKYNAYRESSFGYDILEYKVVVGGKMERGFLSQKGSRGGRGVKENSINKNNMNTACIGLFTTSDGNLNKVTTVIAVKEVEKPYVVDMTMEKETLSSVSSYAKAMIELRADVELKDNIVVAMPKVIREGHYICNVCVEYEWKPPSGNKKKGMVPSIEVSNSNSFEVLNLVDNNVELDTNRETTNLKFEELLTSGKATLVDEAEKVGFGTQSLLEQWRDSYGNSDYDEDPYDDNMYEG
uniref:Reverse transcriptase domain-containing protein n=1 Tax=Tanacetum cinerariifolium TaxID=118510 RepID=A0A6L2M0K1_TANCI|nr:reverse transcriptase domain-containing protein [Tanacetum cinerariifolium]